jgi:hypothetical protein
MNSKDYTLAYILEKYLGRLVTISQANILRRAELALHSWYEHECMGQWEDEETGKVYRTNGYTTWIVANTERGALRRIQKVCEELGCGCYIQTDPRGRSLYILKDSSEEYTRGVCCFI